MRGGVLIDRAFTAVRAGSWDGLVYSINGTSGDADGNVNVSTINGHAVNSDVPSSANFAQYDQNTADITTIENKLSGLTATAENVASGYTFIGEGGNVATGTLDTRNSLEEYVKSVEPSKISSIGTYMLLGLNMGDETSNVYYFYSKHNVGTSFVWYNPETKTTKGSPVTSAITLGDVYNWWTTGSSTAIYVRSNVTATYKIYWTMGRSGITTVNASSGTMIVSGDQIAGWIVEIKE